jgi:hypothetical protein
LQSQKVINWKGVIFWGILFGLVGLAIYHFYREPLMAFFNSIPTRISNFQIPDLSTFCNGIIKYINENPIAVIATAASLCTAGITIISKMRAAKQAAADVAQTQQQADTQVNTALASAQQYQQQAQDYKAKYEALANSGNQDALTEAQNLVSTKEGQIKSLQGQVQALQDALLLKETKTVEKTVVK